MNCLKLVVISALTAAAALAQTVAYPSPLGRLSLTSGTAVMASNVTDATTIYYVPYLGGAVVPVQYGTGSVGDFNYSGLSVALNSTYQSAGNVYDVFAFLNPNNLPTTQTPLLGIGPAWASKTSRGSGSGTTQLTLTGGVPGLWQAANPITVYNGSYSYTINNAVGTEQWATYLGSIYVDSGNGVSMNFTPSAASGGPATPGTVLGLYNAYNRVRNIAIASDSNSSWTYSGSSWRPADNSTSNRIQFLDGLQQSAIQSEYSCIMAVTSGSGAEAIIGVTLDYPTNTTPSTPDGFTYATTYFTYTAHGRFLPQYGLHSVQAMEAQSGGSATFVGLGTATQGLMLEIDM